MRQSRKLSRKTGVSLLVGVAALLLLVFYGYRSAQEALTFAPYPTGSTGVIYSGSYRQEFDGQEFAKFKFGNAEGIQLKVTAKVLDWDAQEQRWNEEALTLKETVPNRSQWEVDIARNGKWKVIFQGHAQPSLREKLTDRINRGRTPGGLIGAWSSPEMNDAKPAK
ncbi:MAG: hypothetical protein ACXW3Z_03985 [Limisphaerales bacterium]